MDVETRLIRECDGRRVSELESHIAPLQDEIEALQRKAGQMRELGEEASDDSCGSGVLQSEGTPWWLPILQNASPDPEPWGEARCVGADEWRKTQERRAGRLDEQVRALEAVRDQLAEELGGVE